ncbi:Neutral/alkaline nonlysosomal ceramidase [Terfezia claveryi]|nr:Neutral/alkaline nonlysosomal ceramidase [Terfezia claveryi]
MKFLASAPSALLLLVVILFFSQAADAGPHRRPHSQPRGDKYILGVGKADITGPIGMMGYASLEQKGTGLRQRIYSRAFIVTHLSNSTRTLYIVIDTQGGDTAVHQRVLEKLEWLYPGTYTQSNVAVIGTHSHSGPGAYSNYLLPQISILGRAHESATEGYLYLGKGPVDDAGVNRSPYSYEQNPLKELQKYKDMGNTEKEMQMLMFIDKDGEVMGMLNWFPTHGTSLYKNNTLISGDNKGYAAIRFEKYLRGMGNSKTGRTIVTGFSQANVAPNTLGPVCQDTGLPCKHEDYTCDGKAQQCHARGPGFQESDVESCRIIGERQFLAAKKIYEDILNGGGEPVVGSVVKGIHTFVDFGQEGGYIFKDLNGMKRRTCKAALGFSFADGTTDGPNHFDPPNTPKNPMWLLVRDPLSAPSRDQIECHKPKSILLNFGEISLPYAWSRNIVDIQLLRVGLLTMIISPGGATTMAGRRWKSAISSALQRANKVGELDPWVVIGGPANTYTHYIVTPEEYAVQRYEGASTLYGSYLPYVSDDPPAISVPVGSLPPINAPECGLHLDTGVVYDNPPLGKNFGDVLLQPKPMYSKSGRGSVVEVKFVGGNPRNNLRAEGDFVAIEKQSSAGVWEKYRGDEDWEVTYEWKRVDGVLGTSEVTAKWVVSELEDRGAAEKGRYRIMYFGDRKMPLTGNIVGFKGVSEVFTVV